MAAAKLSIPICMGNHPLKLVVITNTLMLRATTKIHAQSSETRTICTMGSPGTRRQQPARSGFCREYSAGMLFVKLVVQLVNFFTGSCKGLLAGCGDSVDPAPASS